jgi:hypothetical protein
MFRTIAFVCLLALIALGVGRGITSARLIDPSLVDPRLTGYPEVIFRIEDEAIEVPATITAGRTLVVQENNSAHEAHFFILRLPDDVADEQIASDVANLVASTPEWFYRSTLVGNPDRAAPNGGQQYAVVDIAPGRYMVMDPLAQPAKFTRFDAVAPVTFAPAISEAIPGLAVVSDGLGPRNLSHLIAMRAAKVSPTPVEDPAADVVATMFEMDFEMPSSVPAGRQVWQVTNTGAAYHELAIQPVPAGATKEQVIAAFAAQYAGEPLPDDLFPTWINWQYNLVNGVGATSPAGTVWAQFDLQPGTYVAICFVPSNGVPHLMAGMTKIFTVTA